MIRRRTREDLLAQLSRVTLVEALGAPYYANAHLPGAVNLTPDRVDELAATLLPDPTADIVVYSADERCACAHGVIRRLAALGYERLSWYAEGKAGWTAAGLPLEVSA